MPRFINTRGKSNLAIAVCGRCWKKMANADLQRDPDSRLMVCSDCVDESDPWRLPPRAADRIALPFVQRDAPIEALPTGGPVFENPDPVTVVKDFNNDFSTDFSGGVKTQGEPEEPEPPPPGKSFSNGFSSGFPALTGTTTPPPGPSNKAWSSGFSAGFGN